jgi:hypothetical protein
VGTREIEAILADAELADAPAAARIARIADGRPGLAIAWARHPDALRERDALGRALLDLSAARPADRLSGIRTIAAGAAALIEIGAAIDGATPGAAPSAASAAPTRGRRPRASDAAGSAGPAPSDESSGTSEDGVEDDAATPARAPATERRKAAEAVLALWTDVARDLALCQRGLPGSVRDLARLDETQALVAVLDPAEVARFLDRLGEATVRLATNVSPELLLDDLALAWPARRRRAA